MIIRGRLILPLYYFKGGAKVPRKKISSRLDTYNKLKQIKKSNTKDVAKLTLEDIETIIDNEDFRNIILLRKYIKKGEPLDYFNDEPQESEENKNEQ